MRNLPVSVSGLVVALLGFILTRFTVTLAAMDDTVQFLFAGIIPLILGLSLSAFGVVLAVSSSNRAYVQTIAGWSILGTLTMLALVILTIVGSSPGRMLDISHLRDQTYLSNFLIGGAIGGTLTGLYAAENSRHKQSLNQQANRLILLNRLLRDKIINKATAIKGHQDVLCEEYNQKSIDVVGAKADEIIEIVENVKYLSETASHSSTTVSAIDLHEILTAELEAVETRFESAECELTVPVEEIEVLANTQIREVFRHLFENAIEYSDAEPPRLDVVVEANRTTASIRISDNGPGLPPTQQTLLERGEISEFDDPTTGFGLNNARLLLERYDGQISTSVDSSGSTIEIVLPRAGTHVTTHDQTPIVPTPNVPPSRIRLTIVASLMAGITMGIAMVVAGGDIPVIGALYGIENLPVALLTHEFHSVVFGLMYAGLLSVLPIQYARNFSDRVGVAIAMGIILWIVAAGIVMPIWLQLVGIDAPLPNLTVPSLIGHVVWGATLGVVYHVGDNWLTKSDLRERIDSNYWG